MIESFLAFIGGGFIIWLVWACMNSIINFINRVNSFDIALRSYEQDIQRLRDAFLKFQNNLQTHRHGEYENRFSELDLKLKRRRR